MDDNTERRLDQGTSSLVIGVALLGVALLLGLGFSVWQLQAVRARDAEAAKAAAQADALVLQQLAAISSASPAPSRSAIASLPREAMVSDVLSRAEERLETFEDDPSEEAAIRMTLARTHAQLGDHDAASAQLARVLELVRGPESVDASMEFDAMELLERLQAAPGSGDG